MADDKNPSRGGMLAGISPELRTALITVTTAIVSAVATIAVAYVGGFFDVAKTDAASRGSIGLERLKFSNDLIKSALASNNPANSLLFYADVGLLEGLTINSVKDYAKRESDRLKQGGGGTPILPSFDKSARPTLWLDREFMTAFAPRAESQAVNALVSTGNYLLLGFGINASPKRLAVFLGQIAYETGGFAVFAENGNYSKPRLMQVWPRFFDEAKATEYANKPDKILSYVYANRLGNGPEDSGDGYRYRSRGLLQLAGKAQYERYAKETGVDLLTNPDAMSDANLSLLVAASFWYANGLNDLADADRFADITKKINGGLNGLEDRQRFADRALKLLTDRPKPGP
jgi:putative chitinase